MPYDPAFGGGRADYGFLRYADEFWGSDDTDARERVFILSQGVPFFLTGDYDSLVLVLQAK